MSLKLKARIAAHGNEDSDMENVHSSCCMCPPLSIRAVATTATVQCWSIMRADAEAAFLQTGPTNCNVYIRPRAESSNCLDVL